MSKPKLAVYWAASCGGCDIAILDIEEKILEVADFFDVVFWPCAMDFKYEDIEAMEDKSITLTLFNGGIRSDENHHLAELLRRKSVVLCAFGSCAHEGCIPGLANLTTERFEGLDSDFNIEGGINWHVSTRGVFRTSLRIGITDGGPDSALLAGYAHTF